jgi:hypothetical protein
VRNERSYPSVSPYSFMARIGISLFFDLTVITALGGACSTYEGREEAYRGFWWGSLRERDHLEHQGVDGMIILRWILRKRDGGLWTGLSWLRTGTGDGHMGRR